MFQLFFPLLKKGGGEIFNSEHKTNLTHRLKKIKVTILNKDNNGKISVKNIDET